MTEIDLERLQQKADDAANELAQLCHGSKKWTMHIPADESQDSDLILGRAIGGTNELITAIRERDERIANQEKARNGYMRELVGVEGSLAKALNFPNYPNDWEAGDERCVGEHTADSLAAEAAARIAELVGALRPFAECENPKPARKALARSGKFEWKQDPCDECTGCHAAEVMRKHEQAGQ